MTAEVPGRGTLRLSFGLVAVVTALGLVAGPSGQQLSAGRFARHVTILASDHMKGRGNGSPELDRAADYIAREFAASGLRALGDGDSFFQDFPLALDAIPDPTSALWLNGVEQRAHRDFITLPLSTSGSYQGGAVFAGYGISAPQYGWDDYAGLDVANKAVVVLVHQPIIVASLVRPLGFLSSLEMKARNAKRHGASAIIFVADPASDRDPSNPPTPGYVAPQDAGLLAVLMSSRATEPLFRSAGTTVGAARRSLDSAGRPGSFALSGASVRLFTQVQRHTRQTRNVVGVLQPAGPSRSDEWLVIGAHYDHMGLGGGHGTYPANKGRIHHGADDNASGTAGLLELARALAKDRWSLKRSIVFVAFAGEEVGLVGSNHFLEHAPLPVASMSGMLNLDMIGRLSTDPVFVMGSPIPTDLAEWIRTENLDAGLTLAFSPDDSASSDWAVFQAAGVPALTFFTGIHADYHRPSDTAEKINADGAVRILSLVAGTARRMAGTGPVTWKTLVSPVPASDDDPYLGAEPVQKDGFEWPRLASVTRESPAARAGLRRGDVIVDFGGFATRSLNDFKIALQSFRPGDMPALHVRRAGRPMRMVVALE